MFQGLELNQSDWANFRMNLKYTNSDALLALISMQAMSIFLCSPLTWKSTAQACSRMPEKEKEQYVKTYGAVPDVTVCGFGPLSRCLMCDVFFASW